MMPTLEKTIHDAILSWETGKSLPAGLYNDDSVFDRDINWLLDSQWFLTGHVSQIPNPGDFHLYQVGNESVIINRSHAGDVKAFHNTCRHRGSRVCLEQQGSKRLFTCPYHAWSYDLDGALVAARAMPDDFDKSSNGLLPVEVGVFEGLIFIHFQAGQDKWGQAGVERDTAERAGDFKLFTERFSANLLHQGLAAGKIAARKTYPTKANWKLVVENFFECYHCQSAHPTYCGVHDSMKLLAFGSDADSVDGIEAYRDKLEQWQVSAREKGYPTGMFADGPDSMFLQASSRLPVADEALTESIDGKPLAPLMSELGEFDGGQTGCVFNPLTTILVCNDHAVVFLFIPMAAQLTHVEAIWLVNATASEGTDYNVDALMHVWDTTLTEDKIITENNQLGILSRGYRPGTLSQHEVRIADFGLWYIRHWQQ